MRKYKTWLLLSLLWGAQLIIAQDTLPENGIFEFENNKPQKVFIDKAKLRIAPSLKSEIVDSLNTNQEVIILKQDHNLLHVGERIAHWYLVSYHKNNKALNGYIWGGNLCVGYQKRDNYEFLLGISTTKTEPNKEGGGSYPVNMASVKLLQDNILVQERFFETNSGDGLNYAELSLEENKQLQNVEFILKATFSGEACGIPTSEQYFLFVNKELVPLPLLMSVSEASIFHHSEEYIFPNENGGIANTIIQNTEDEETDEVTNKEKIQKKKTVYGWDGKKITKK